MKWLNTGLRVIIGTQKYTLFFSICTLSSIGRVQHTGIYTNIVMPNTLETLFNYDRILIFLDTQVY